VRRHDTKVATHQRRLCVPLARWVDAVHVEGPVLFVSAQIGADASGVLQPSAELQCLQCFENLRRALHAGHRTVRDVAKLTVYMVHGQCGLAEFRLAAGRFFPDDALPAVSIVFVVALATENILVQIDAVTA